MALEIKLNYNERQTADDGTYVDDERDDYLKPPAYEHDEAQASLQANFIALMEKTHPAGGEGNLIYLNQFNQIVTGAGLRLEFSKRPETFIFSLYCLLPKQTFQNECRTHFQSFFMFIFFTRCMINKVVLNVFYLIHYVKLKQFFIFDKKLLPFSISCKLIPKNILISSKVCVYGSCY